MEWPTHSVTRRAGRIYNCVPAWRWLAVSSACSWGSSGGSMGRRGSLWSSHCGAMTRASVATCPGELVALLPCLGTVVSWRDAALPP